MAGYAARELARGERLSWITRHMLGLYSGHGGCEGISASTVGRARAIPEAGPGLLLEAGRACELGDTAHRIDCRLKTVYYEH